MGAESGPKLRRGRTGRSPRDDVGSPRLARCPDNRVSISSGFRGGGPLPFSFFLNGVLWGGAEGSEGPTRPSVISAAIAV